MRTKITKKAVDALAIGRSLADVEIKGFRARRLPSGTVSYELRYSTGTGRSWIKLGEHGSITPDEARRLAKLRAGEVAAGKDPGAHKRATAERSFAALADRYLREHARRHKRTAAADELALKVHVLPHWHRKDFATLRRADLIKLIEGIIAAGKPAMANRVHALISSMFSFALDGDLVPANPFLRLRKRGAERVKTRVLTDDEIRLFWSCSVTTLGVGRATGIALRLLLILGARASEVALMQRGEIEFQNGEPVGWELPARRSKSNRARRLPLPPLGVNLIAEALLLAKGSEAVFPLSAGHALANAMARITAALPENAPGTDTWRADPPTCHDLRRTCATRMAADGVATEDVGAVLGHVLPGITSKHYAHYSRNPEKAKALARWSTILSAILKPSESGVVVPLRR
jgi:integrase